MSDLTSSQLDAIEAHVPAITERVYDGASVVTTTRYLIGGPERDALLAMARAKVAAESAAARRLEVLRRVFDGYGDAMDLDLRDDIDRELETP